MAFYFATGFEEGQYVITWDIETFLRLENHTVKHQDDLKAIFWSMRGLWPSAIEKVAVKVTPDGAFVKVMATIKEGRERDCVDTRHGRTYSPGK